MAPKEKGIEQKRTWLSLLEFDRLLNAWEDTN